MVPIYMLLQHFESECKLPTRNGGALTFDMIEKLTFANKLYKASENYF
jgi:hypothetical protein